MSLLKEWESDAYSLAAIWEITEPESFYTERTGLQPDIKNEKRRLEFLAGRFLLKYLKEDFPLHNIKPDLQDKPRIDNNGYFFSISHSYPYVAAVISPYKECGIDIQTWHPGMDKLQHKFLSAPEQVLFKNDNRLITLAWCAKEAVYKWQGKRGVEFIDHLPISKFDLFDENYKITIILELNLKKSAILTECSVYNDFAISIVVNE